MYSSLSRIAVNQHSFNNYRILSRLEKSVSAHTRFIHGSKILRFPIQSVNILKDQEIIKINLHNGLEERFPWHFFQDNCTCNECFDSASKSRKKRMTDLDLTISVSEAEIINGHNKNELKIKWSNGHEGIFSESWILERSFSKSNENFRKTGLRDNLVLVESNYKMKCLDFNDVLENDAKLLECLQDLCKHGVTMLQNSPKQVGQLRKLSNKIGFMRTTHYGNEFTVRSIPNASNLAYTSNRLNVHTDLPYYVYPPGVQLLHCIKQFYSENDAAIGGESHLVDGFIVAEHMKKHYTEQYETLCQIPVEFMDVGKDYTEFNKVHHSPTFVTCPRTGNISRIVYSNQQLSSYLPVDLEKVPSLYKALKTFTNLCYDEKFLLRFKLKEGEILIFDNWRFLHGRSEFDPTKGERHLEGCYIDWDEIFSKIRVISFAHENKS